MRKKARVSLWRNCRMGNKKLMDKKAKRNDIILISVLISVSLVLYFGVTLFQGKTTKDGVAVVTIDGKEYGRYPLSEDTTEKIELPDGSYNILEIRDGKADITEASCPDKICVNHRAVNRRGQSIVCLPNKLIVEIENGEESDVDLVTN